MPIKSSIIGGRSGDLEADITDGFSPDRFRPRGLVGYTLPYEVETNSPVYATNLDNGVEMGINATSSGSSDGIHDGTDSVLWTAAATVGTWDFASTTQANDGTKSISGTSTVNNDKATLTRSSAINPLIYNTLEGAVYIQSWSGGGTKEIRLQLQLAGVATGVQIGLSSYVNTGSTGVWQNFVIPLEDFSLPAGNIDQLTIETIDIGGGPAPDYFLDSLILQATSAGTGPQTYVIKPDPSEILRVYGLSWTIVDAYTPNAGVGGVTSLSYDTFGGLSSLSNGVQVRRIQAGATLFTNTARNHSDIIAGPGGRIAEHWYDGTNVYLKTYTELARPIDLNGQSGDMYEFVVQDNLSGLISFNVRANAALITRPNGDSV